jgi:chemotaxis protein CheD
MSHYLRPYRQSHPSTAIFAAPAIVALVRMFQTQGSSTGDIEAHLYGGAVNPHSLSYVEGLSEKNVQVGLEVLSKLEINIAGQDVGGSRARKIVFNTRTGETLVAKVDRVRETDWYPEMGAVAGFRRE